DTNTIIFTISKDVIGTDVASYRYVIVSGSQDGFGTGKYRDVDETSKTWTLGGGSDPAPDDGIEYDPNVLDIVRMDDQQATILAEYDVANHEFAQLTGFEMPEISQQIYGASVLTVTDSTAIVSWSTTKQSDSQINCLETNQSGDGIISSSSELTISHQLEVSGLDSGKEYTCTITTQSDADLQQLISFQTLSETDSTPPQILNIRAVTDDTGLTVVSWFTDEDTFGTITVDETLDTDFGKNHATSYALCVGEHTAQITATDPSGNQASQSFEFDVEGDGKECSDSSRTSKVKTDDETSMLSSTNVQIVALVVVLLVTLALMRTRRDTFE
ncbi:MAG: glucodextranase DOMON-like domain-containing protein, partial [Candidatus Thermoplasmatota archaeon]|nr:glucodextranase DOMON-like domain-containing protein [Candidatus Thermoplasmatota archaeon]